jgi:hypothetical protein
MAGLPPSSPPLVCWGWGEVMAGLPPSSPPPVCWGWPAQAVTPVAKLKLINKATAWDLFMANLCNSEMDSNSLTVKLACKSEELGN